jgi:H+-transporting ATPase
MLTYTLNKLAETLEIALFLTIGVIAARAFVITPPLIVLLFFASDFMTITIATDSVAFSRRPDRWSVRNLMIAGGGLAALILFFSFSVFFVGRDVLKLPLKELQTFIFVMLVLTGQGTLYLARERRHFWQSRPSRFLLLSSVADIAAVFFLASRGLLMAAVSIGLLVLLFLSAIFYLFLVDQIKVVLFRRFRIR